MDDDALRNRLAARGRDRVLKHYDLARNVEALAAIFSQRVK